MECSEHEFRDLRGQAKVLQELIKKIGEGPHAVPGQLDLLAGDA